MKKIIQKTSLFLSLFILALCFGFVLQAWTGPVSAPPADNLPQPINISSTDQEKAGRFSATEFYDADDADFYINPAGASKISGNLSLGGNLIDITNSKTIYDATTGKISPLVMPYKKGAITSDWATTDYTAGYYDVSNLTAGTIAIGTSYGRADAGSLRFLNDSYGSSFCITARENNTYKNNATGAMTGNQFCQSFGLSCASVFFDNVTVGPYCTINHSSMYDNNIFGCDKALNFKAPLWVSTVPVRYCPIDGCENVAVLCIN